MSDDNKAYRAGTVTRGPAGVVYGTQERDENSKVSYAKQSQEEPDAVFAHASVLSYRNVSFGKQQLDGKYSRVVYADEPMGDGRPLGGSEVSYEALPSPEAPELTAAAEAPVAPAAEAPPLEETPVAPTAPASKSKSASKGR